MDEPIYTDGGLDITGVSLRENLRTGGLGPELLDNADFDAVSDYGSWDYNVDCNDPSGDRGGDSE